MLSDKSGFDRSSARVKVKCIPQDYKGFNSSPTPRLSSLDLVGVPTLRGRFTFHSKAFGSELPETPHTDINYHLKPGPALAAVPSALCPGSLQFSEEKL